jgi:uncharacterized BrkB/YihY/UPF0761 family membrane protein
MFAAATGVMIAALLIVSGSHVVTVRAASAPPFASVWWVAAIRSLALQYLATILFIIAVGLLYYFVPNERARFRDVWVGAVFTGALWRGGFEIFSWMTNRNAQIQVGQRLHRRGGAVPDVGLRVVGHSDVRCGVHRRPLRARRHLPATAASA